LVSVATEARKIFMGLSLVVAGWSRGARLLITRSVCGALAITAAHYNTALSRMARVSVFLTWHPIDMPSLAMLSFPSIIPQP